MLHQTGGSIPEQVMRTSVWKPFNPLHARQDIDPRHVIQMTSSAVGINPAADVPTIPQPLPPAPPTPATNAVAQTTTAVPPRPLPSMLRPHPHAYPHPHAWQHRPTMMLGATLGQWRGHPVATFQIDASPPRERAPVIARKLQQAARAIVEAGHAALPAEVIGGPLAALVRGGAVELHFKNGVVVRTAP